MSAVWVKVLPYLVAFCLVGAILFGTYHFGGSVRDARWQVRWDARDAKDARAAERNEASERAKEQSRQQSINKAIEDGQKILDQVSADLAAANSDRSVRDSADAAAHSVAVSQAGGHSCTAAASAAATRAVMVLADVFKRSDERSGDLAGYADQSHGRGVTCEQAYDALGK
ncbi:DUF2514 family protein [Pseudomonas sp. O64]|uniref:DUF2514 family protein n=1 Tax=unclassified Pseudomonas TaxID=196821 RepID=UPI00387A8DE5